MKTTIKNFLVGGILVLTGGLVSCEDAEYNVLGVHGFIAESTTSESTKVVVAKGGADATVTACLSETYGEDVTLKFVVDPSVMEEYNKTQSASFVALPEGSYEFEQEVTIKAGNYSAEPTQIHIKEFTSEMLIESYALPLRLVSVDGKVPMMPQTGTFVITTENVAPYSLPLYQGGTGFSAEMPNGPETYSAFTVEARFQISDTGNRNRTVFSNGSGGSDNLLLRFEDPQSDQPDGTKGHSLIQVVGRDGKFLNPGVAMETNKWQHYAITFNGSEYRLYVNGGFAGVLDIPDGPTTFTGMNWFGAADDSWWGDCKMLMTEMRVWSVCRTDAQIQNNMTSVGTKSPGLEGYWRLSDGKSGDGTSYADLTGKGHTLKTTKKPTKWIDDIMSSDSATPW